VFRVNAARVILFKKPLQSNARRMARRRDSVLHTLESNYIFRGI
jgi:hypothetical protein